MFENEKPATSSLPALVPSVCLRQTCLAGNMGKLFRAHYVYINLPTPCPGTERPIKIDLKIIFKSNKIVSFISNQVNSSAFGLSFEFENIKNWLFCFRKTDSRFL